MRFSVASVLTATLVFVSSAAGLTADQQKALDIHNKSRATKGLSALTWDNGLVSSAQACANKIASSGNFAHCQSGENLYGQTGSSTTPLAAGAQAWVNEAPNYHGEKIPDGNFGAYGHYSEYTNTSRRCLSALLTLLQLK
jgi:pathogenesis-related protein 1